MGEAGWVVLIEAKRHPDVPETRIWTISPDELRKNKSNRQNCYAHVKHIAVL